LTGNFLCGESSIAIKIKQLNEYGGLLCICFCFAELRLDKVDFKVDDELTNLSWLQDNDLLKNIKSSDVGNIC
jgi:hypothetical protein